MNQFLFEYGQQEHDGNTHEKPDVHTDETLDVHASVRQQRRQLECPKTDENVCVAFTHLERTRSTRAM